MSLHPRSVFGGAFGTTSDIGSFRSDRAVLRERSDLGCVLLTTATTGPEIARAASSTCGIELPAVSGPITWGTGIAGRHLALWLTPHSWLIHCDLEGEDDLLKRLAAAFPDKLAHAVSFTDAVCWMELSGPRAWDLLTEGGFVSLEPGELPVGHAKRTLIAQVAVVLIHQATDSWLFAIERSRALYFVDWLASAAEARE